MKKKSKILVFVLALSLMMGSLGLQGYAAIETVTVGVSVASEGKGIVQVGARIRQNDWHMTGSATSIHPRGATGTQHASEFTVTAFDYALYEFDYWYVRYSSEPNTYYKNYTPTITRYYSEDIAFYAVYKEKANVVSHQVSASATTGGSVSPASQTYYEGWHAASLTASADSHYSFNGWTLTGGTTTGVENTSEPTMSFHPTSDVSYQANFVPATYSVTVQDIANGTTTPLGVQASPYGSAISVSASPDTRYNFDHWEVIGSQMAGHEIDTSSPTVNVYPASNVTLTPVYIGEVYNVTIATASNGSGTATPDGDVNYPATTSIVANADDHYHFTGWSITGDYEILNDGSLSDESLTIRALGTSVICTPTFEGDLYNVTIGATTNGSGTATPEGDIRYDGTSELNAIANNHYHFTGWSITGDYELISGSVNDETMVIRAEGTVVATPNFLGDTFNVSIGSTINGTGDASPSGDIIHPQSIELTATPAVGYNFTYWDVEGDYMGKGSINMGVEDLEITPYSDVVCTPIFEMKETYPVTIDLNENAGGNSVSYDLVSNTGIEYPEGSGNFTEGSELILSYVEGPEYRFDRWELASGGATIQSPYVISAPTDIVGIFEKVLYDIGTESNILGRGTTVATTDDAGTSGGTDAVVLKTHEVTIVASPATGCFFKKWIDGYDGHTVSTNQTYTFTPVGDSYVIAVFDTNPSNEDPYAPGPGTPPTPAEEPEVEPVVEPVQEPEQKPVVAPEEETEPEAEPATDQDQEQETGQESELVPDEELVPEDVPVDGESDDGVEDVLNQELPEGTPAMPQTAGIPIGFMMASGAILSGMGIKVRRKR